MKTLQALHIFPHQDDWPWEYALYIVILLLTIAVSASATKQNFSPQVVSMIFGSLFGILVFYNPKMETLIRDDVDVGLMLQMYYPIVILKCYFNTDPLMLWHALPHIMCIVFLKVIIAGTCHVLIYYHLIGSSGGNLMISVSVLLGIIQTSNDVPDITINSERMKYLECLLLGDGIIGSGIAIAIVQCIFNKVLHMSSVSSTIFVFLRLFFASTVVGFIVAIPLAFPLRYFYNDSLNAITYMFFVTYGVFEICQNTFAVSGIFSCIILVVFFNVYRSKLSDEVVKEIQNTINILYYFITTTMHFVCSVILVSTSYPFTTVSIGEGFVEFVFILVTKIIVNIMLFPILKRSRYGYNLNVMVALLWGGKWGPAQIYGPLMAANNLQLFWTTDNYSTFVVQKTYVMYMVINIVQFGSFNFILRKFGFLDLSFTRKSNIKECAIQINRQRLQHLSVIKMDRAYNEANWNIIYQLTDIKGLTEGLIEDNGNFNMLTKVMTCNKCSNTVSFEPDVDQLNDLLREVRIGILKALRVSFVRQYEQGFIDNVEINTLQQSVDFAMNTKGLSLKFDDLTKFQKIHVLPKQRKYNFLSIEMCQQNIPNIPFRRRCYSLVINKNFEKIYLAMNFLCILTAFVLIFLDISTVEEKIIVFVMDSFFHAIFLFEMFMKVISCSYSTVGMGFLTYLCVIRNSVSFALYLISSVDFILYIVYAFPNMISLHTLSLYIRISRITRLLRIFIIVIYFYPQLQSILRKNVQEKNVHSIAIAVAMVSGYEEILDILPTLTDNKRLYQIVKVKITAEKLQIIKDLGLAEVAAPQTSICAKTKQAIMISLIAISETIKELTFSGLVDVYENQKLVESLDERMEKFGGMKGGTVVPKDVLHEISWIAKDETLFNFLYTNVETRIWKPGDVIVRVGDVIPGVFILVTGMFKLTYMPSDQLKDDMHTHGVLPIKDFLESTAFCEPEDTYAMVGNSIGELCQLTKRPYDITITAFAPSQAFVISHDVLMRAIDMNRDPINGLESRIWRSILTNIVKAILKVNPIYRAIGFDDMNCMLDRAFVPNLKCFKVFVIIEFIQDVLLVEGNVTDYGTGDTFKAPCSIPRSTQKITIFDSDSIVQPILVIIPLPDVDQYDLLEYSEAHSELIPQHDSDCMLHVKHYHKEPLDSRFFLNMKKGTSPSLSLQLSVASKKMSAKYDTSGTSQMTDTSGATIHSKRSVY